MGFINEDDRERLTFPLGECDFTLNVDPAGTEHYISAKTSRSVVLGLATHWTGVHALVYLRVGYVAANEMFDWIFAGAEKFKLYLRNTYLESNAGFKVLGPLLMKEQETRGIYLGLRPFPSVGEKTARIRNDLDMKLKRGEIYVLRPYYDEVYEEIRAFPQSSRMDILDALSIGVRNAQIPPNPTDLERYEIEKELKKVHMPRNTTGY